MYTWIKGSIADDYHIHEQQTNFEKVCLEKISFNYAVKLL